MQTSGQIDERMELAREVDTERAAIMVSKDSLHIRRTSSTKTELTGDEEITTTIREYDTDKPVDPLTGTPPLKSETTQTRRRADASRREQTTSQATDRQREGFAITADRQTDRTAIRGDVRGRANVTTRVETAEKRGQTTTQRVLCAIGALAILTGLVWLGRKLLKRYL